MPPPSGSPSTARALVHPRDTQRSRVYRAESHLAPSPLPGLDACARYAGRVVGTLWWAQRFPDRDLGTLPRFRPGNGARRAFFRDEADDPSITLPRRYRTKGVVLHELAHWALGLGDGLAAHGETFTRVLLDLTSEFGGIDAAAALHDAFAAERVRIGAPASCAPHGQLRYGDDERARRGRLRSAVR
jgi:putative metallohydrolase (TIGR04338 family)